MPPAPLAATYVVIYILIVVPEKSLMRNLCVRDRMATDAPLVAMVMGTEGEAIAAGNAVVAAMPTSAAVCACRMMMPDQSESWRRPAMRWQ